MKIITFKHQIDIAGSTVKAGEPVLLPDGTAARLKADYFDHVEISPVDSYYNRYAGQALDGRSLLLVRNGGFGDLLFLTPLFRYLDEKYRRANLAVVCGRRYHATLLHNRNIRRIYSYPVKLSDFVSYDYHLFFEGTLETSTDPDYHAVDLMAGHAGVTDVGDRRLVFEAEPALVRKAGNILRHDLGVKSDDTKVALHIRASSPIRTYPLEHSLGVAAALGAAGARVFLLGAPGDWAKTVGRKLPASIEIENVDNLCGRFRTVNHTAAFLSKMDLLIGPDSSLVHFAGALSIPTVALYGPFPGNVRTRYYPRCVTLEGRYAQGPGDEECAPCFVHGSRPCPKAGGDGVSPCLRNLEPEEVVRTALAVLVGGRGKNNTNAKRMPAMSCAGR
jgi:ADP-heptose:LPS heptosyltransferase